MASESLHPLIDNPESRSDPNYTGGTLKCKCSSNPVEVTLKTNVAHNHACGCSKCWKPKGALFSVVGVVPVDKLEVTANEDKLKVIDSSAVIRRNACSECGVHMYGRIEQDHAFKGLDFVHAELSKGQSPSEKPQFAAFVSSIIEQGFKPEGMDEIRDRLRKAGLEPYDCLSPALMDLIATFNAKKSGALPA